MFDEINRRFREIVETSDMSFIGHWGVECAHDFAWIQQYDTQKIRVKIDKCGDFNAYNKIKEDVKQLFCDYDYVMYDEDIIECKGYRFNRILYFWGKEEYEKMKKEQEIKASQFNIGTFNAFGANIIFGDAINTTQTINNSMQVIEKAIEEKGGEDKTELYETLKQVKDILEELKATNNLSKKEGLPKRLGDHFLKHNWFYVEIVKLLGTVLTQQMLNK